jgi:hypothetical protein
MRLAPKTPAQAALLARIDEFFEAEFARQAIMAFPLEAALAHTLRVAELKVLFTGQHAALADRPDILWPSRRLSQDSLRHAVYRLFRHATPGGAPTSTYEREMEAAVGLLRYAEKFCTVDDSLTTCRLGLAEIREDPANTFRFEMTDPEAAARLEARQPQRERGNVAAMSARASKPPGPAHANLGILARERVATLGPYSFYYYRDRELLDAGLALAIDEVQQLPALLPRGWSIGPYTLDDFWRLWASLCNLTTVHQVATIVVTAQTAPGYLPVNTPLLECPSTYLVSLIAARSGIAEPIVGAILHDLTYDPNVRFTDIMFQPLIPAGDRVLVLPSIIEGSNAERNLVALWNKIPERKATYDRLSLEKEAIFLREIEAFLRAARIEVRLRVVIPNVTDADLVAWRPGENSFLVVQAKWLYGPDSVLEVYTHDSQLQEGVAQAEGVIAWARGNPGEFRKRCGLPERNGQRDGYLGVVVSRVGGATCYAGSATVPIVELDEVASLLTRNPATSTQQLHADLLAAVATRAHEPISTEVVIEFPPFAFVKTAYDY